MGILGLTDPAILGAYAGCILCVVFGVVYSLVKGLKPDDGDESDE